jgi:hypothetical protein
LSFEGLKLLKTAPRFAHRTLMSWLNAEHMLVVRTSFRIKCRVAISGLSELAMDSTTAEPDLVPLGGLDPRSSVVYNSIYISQGVRISAETN